MTGGTEQLQVGRVVGLLGGDGHADDVVHRRRGLGQPEAGARPADGFVAEDLRPDRLLAGRPVDAGGGGVALDEVVGPVRVATEAEDPS